MVTKKQVTNEDIQNALKNPDNKGIIKGVTSKFKLLSKDDRHLCGLHGLWKALQYHDDSYNQKFTTSLYTFVQWECLKSMEQIYKKKFSFHEQSLDDIVEETPEITGEDIEHLLVRLDGMDSQQKKIIKQYFFEKNTLAQLGKLNGCSAESARQRLKKAIAQLKERYEAD